VGVLSQSLHKFASIMLVLLVTGN